MSEVTPFTGNTTLPEEPNSILEKAKNWDLEQVVICGWDRAGKFVYGGSHSEIGENLLLVEMSRKSLIAMVTE